MQQERDTQQGIPERTATGFQDLFARGHTRMFFVVVVSTQLQGCVWNVFAWGSPNEPQIPRLLWGLVTQAGEGNGTPFQYSCLENPMDRGAWYASVHGVTKSRAQPSDFTFTFHFHALEMEMATHSSVLPGESQGRGSLVGCRLCGCTESDTTEATQQQQLSHRHILL